MMDEIHLQTIHDRSQDINACGIPDDASCKPPERRLGEIENSLFKKNIPFEAVSYEDSKDLIQNSLELNKDRFTYFKNKSNKNKIHPLRLAKHNLIYKCCYKNCNVTLIRLLLFQNHLYIVSSYETYNASNIAN